jgi:hypothetical protein
VFFRWCVTGVGRFNKALATYLPSGQKSGIDGIVLTKFDTIDDKVASTRSGPSI